MATSQKMDLFLRSMGLLSECFRLLAKTTNARDSSRQKSRRGPTDASRKDALKRDVLKRDVLKRVLHGMDVRLVPKAFGIVRVQFLKTFDSFPKRRLFARFVVGLYGEKKAVFGDDLGRWPLPIVPSYPTMQKRASKVRERSRSMGSGQHSNRLGLEQAHPSPSEAGGMWAGSVATGFFRYSVKKPMNRPPTKIWDQQAPSNLL